MNERLQPKDLTRAEAMSLLAWWIEAGVDVAVQDAPRDWRAKAVPTPPEPVEQQTAPVSQPARPTSGGTLPTTLEAFHAHLAESADLPLFRAGAARALPHGPESADLMLLTGIPTPEDTAEGQPIGGAAWALTQRMLRAAGLAPEQAYVAALTCFSGMGTRFSAAESNACRDTILAQIALAAPKRLLLLGDQPAKLLLGEPMASARGKLHRLAGIPTAVTFPPRQLLGKNGYKPLAWADLLLITGA
ncbi:DNA polymerase [Sphingomonas kaistensis]|uniref:DNA polymerase n=1 Tax=Sphingomonas kaistensis TaxID=298708 RepID=A0A7X5Y756_9SPHN|nr:uracil-DNA glycosylase family protein [Sphingomonas kaistensis]NJC06349.1 DNA polymerase [Sphingomonas kaistensis]